MPPKKKPHSTSDNQIFVALTDEPLIFTVSQITQYLQDLIEADSIASDVITVRGELSNVRQASSGHYYITLKDKEASISLIVWASTAKRLKFKLEDGLDIYASGKIEIYPRQGSYSLICKSIEPVGVGGLQLAFEQLKKKLQAEGLFEERHKKELPEYPERIGIITAQTGAVIHDMLRVIRRKYPLINILIYPVPVQGEHAPIAITEALKELNRNEYNLDLLVLARGGGSFEDLFCFSSEEVVRAIFASKLPVITGIGHEPDFSLADAVADASASTPTAAADLIVPDTEELLGVILHYQTVLIHGIERTVHMAERAMDDALSSLPQVLEKTVMTAQYKLQQLSNYLETLLNRLYQQNLSQVQALASNLDALSPLKTLARGYSIALDSATGKTISSTTELKPKQLISIHLTDGRAEAEIIMTSK